MVRKDGVTFPMQVPDTVSDAEIRARVSRLVIPPTVRSSAAPDVSQGAGFVGQANQPSYTDEQARSISEFLNRNRANIYGAAAGLAAGQPEALISPTTLRALLSSFAGGIAGQAQSELERPSIGMEPSTLMQGITNVARAGPEQMVKEATGIGMVRGGVGVGNYLARQSLKEPGTSSDALKALAQSMIEERIPVGAFKGVPGSDRAINRFKIEYGSEVNAAARQAYQRGVMYSADDVAQYGIDRVNRQLVEDGRPMLTPQAEQNIRNETLDTMNNLIETSRRNQGGRTNMFTPMEVLRASRRLNEVLKGRFGVSAEFQNLATNQGTQTDLMAGVSRAVGSEPAMMTPIGSRTLSPSRFIRGETGAPQLTSIGELRRRVGRTKDLAEALRSAEGRTTQHAYGFSAPTVAARTAGGALTGNMGSLPVKEFGGAAAAAAVLSRKLASRAALGLTEPAVQDILLRQLPRYVLPYWLTNQQP